MILYDPAVIANFRDYGIMLPIASDRGKQVLNFLNENNLSDKFRAFDFSSAQTYLKSRSEKTPCKLSEPSLSTQNENTLREISAHDKYLLNREDLRRVHSKTFIRRLYGEGLNAALLNAFELIDPDGKPNRYEPDRAIRPLSDLFQVLLAQAGGTYLASLLALSEQPAFPEITDNAMSDAVIKKSGFCYYLGGGMHHARYDAPSGFCLINDIAAAAFKILKEKSVSLIWIIDMDAHKGDGTAELIHFARKRGELKTPGNKSALSAIYERKNLPVPPAKHPAAPPTKFPAAQPVSGNEKPCILTLSIHMANGWPLNVENLESAREGRAPLLPSDVDIGIDSGDEAVYTSGLAEGLKKLEQLSGKNPDFALVVDGTDPYEHDSLSSSSLLCLTLEQCVERDLHVYQYLQSRKIPSAWIQAGGYGDRAWEPAAYFLKSIS